MYIKQRKIFDGVSSGEKRDDLIYIQENVLQKEKTYLFIYYVYDNPFDLPSKHETLDFNIILKLKEIDSKNHFCSNRELRTYPSLCFLKEIYECDDYLNSFNSIWENL